MYYGQKFNEIYKSFSNENIFNNPSFKKNSRTPLIPTKPTPKISSSLERDQLFAKKPSLMKLRKINKSDQKNLINSSVQGSSKSKEDELFLSNLIKKTNIYLPLPKKLSKKWSFGIEDDEKSTLTVEDILKMSDKDFEMNSDDPRNPTVYLNMIKKKFLF